MYGMPPPWGCYPFAPPNTPINIKDHGIKEWIEEQEAWEKFQEKRKRKDKDKDKEKDSNKPKHKHFSVPEMFCLLTLTALFAPLWMKLIKLYLLVLIP